MDPGKNQKEMESPKIVQQKNASYPTLYPDGDFEVVLRDADFEKCKQVGWATCTWSLQTAVGKGVRKFCAGVFMCPANECNFTVRPLNPGKYKNGGHLPKDHKGVCTVHKTVQLMRRSCGSVLTVVQMQRCPSRVIQFFVSMFEILSLLTRKMSRTESLLMVLHLLSLRSRQSCL
eukprot:TRINITY_DN13644_c0_g1_i6.p2 TRINITY_DN13644_c0_g1~~TRINITY_DN13644_c0_g1_i6.p2  ORF type:complete len:175 (-),score=27.90 TRINITY_DN13644_c0_g1_i6:484-1008(-)